MCTEQILGARRPLRPLQQVAHFQLSSKGPRIQRLTAQIRRVGVHTVEVRGPSYDGPFFQSELWKPVTKHLFHVFRIISEVYWVL